MAQQLPLARRDFFMSLPFEIKSRIVGFLDIGDVNSLRLASRVWAIKCEDQILRNGITLRPNRNHMQKLIEIYSRPRLAEKIQHMTISLDDLDYPFLLDVGTVRPSAASSTVLHVLCMRYYFPVHSHSKPQSCQS